MLLFAAMLLSLTGQDAQLQPAPLAPVTPWAVQYDENACLLSRAFGGSKDKPGVRIVLSLSPKGGTTVLLVRAHSGDSFARSPKGWVELQPAPAMQDVTFRDYVTGKGDQRVTRFWLSTSDVADLERASVLRIGGSTELPATALSLRSIAQALRSVEVCQQQLLRKWGFDPVAFASISKDAEPIDSPVAWMNERDYPVDQLRRNVAGSVGVTLVIDERGKASRCIVISSAGQALDDYTCKLVMARARYHPAIGADGKPTRTLKTLRFTWKSY